MRSEAQHQSCVHRVIDAMKERLDRPFRLEEMAEVAIMSPFHFVRVFREVTGLPPRRFLTALRLSAAKRLLISSDLSVTEVSLEVGYNSLGTFTRRFTEVVGASPMRFRHLAWSDSGEERRFDPPAGGGQGRRSAPMVQGSKRGCSLRRRRRIRYSSACS